MSAYTAGPQWRSVCAWLIVPVALAICALGYAPTAQAKTQPVEVVGTGGSADLDTVTAHHSNTLRTAQQWLEQGHATTAYHLLAPLEADLAGVTQFDWLFGQAALHSDRPSEAAFAFERCLATDPTNGLCRLGMARSHIALQEIASARDELEILSQASPPAAVQDVIADYMAQLSGTEAVNQDTRL